MDTIIGICGKGFALVAADRYVTQSIIRLQKTEDKIFEMDGDKLLATAGTTCDRIQFGEYVQANVHLHRLRNQGRSMTPEAAANFARTELQEALRKQPHQVDTIVAGYNQLSGQAEMYRLDWFGSLCSTKKTAHGFGSHFVFGLMDKEYKEELSLEEAMELLRKCLAELAERFMVGQREFIVKMVSKEGVLPVTVVVP